jgi:hypothetical protein
MRKTAATSEVGGDIRQDLQEDRRPGDRKASSGIFDWATGNKVNEHCGGVCPI